MEAILRDWFEIRNAMRANPSSERTSVRFFRLWSQLCRQKAREMEALFRNSGVLVLMLLAAGLPTGLALGSLKVGVGFGALLVGGGFAVAAFLWSVRMFGCALFAGLARVFAI